MIFLVQLAINKRIRLTGSWNCLQFFVMSEKFNCVYLFQVSLELILLSLKHLPSTVCCNMCIEYRSPAHSVENPFCKYSSNRTSTCYCNSQAFLYRKIIFLCSLLYSSIYILCSICLYSIHLIVKQIVLENMEITQNGYR